MDRVERRRQFCARCGQLMFEYFRSPDGHFGLVDEAPAGSGSGNQPGRSQSDEIRRSTCGARYRLLDRLSATGQPIERR